MSEIRFSRQVLVHPEFGPGEAVLRVVETAGGCLVAGIHGSPDGHLSFVVVVEDPATLDELYSFHVDTEPCELRELVEEFCGPFEGSLFVAPCYPTAVARAQREALEAGNVVVLGDWDVPTIHGWGGGVYEYTPYS